MDLPRARASGVPTVTRAPSRRTRGDRPDGCRFETGVARGQQPFHFSLLPQPLLCHCQGRVPLSARATTCQRTHGVNTPKVKAAGAVRHGSDGPQDRPIPCLLGHGRPGQRRRREDKGNPDPTAGHAPGVHGEEQGLATEFRDRAEHFLSRAPAPTAFPQATHAADGQQAGRPQGSVVFAGGPPSPRCPRKPRTRITYTPGSSVSRAHHCQVGQAASSQERLTGPETPCGTVGIAENACRPRSH